MENIFILSGCLIPSLYLAYTDARYYLLKNYVTFPIFFIGIIYAIYFSSDFKMNLLGAGLVFVIYFFMYLMGGLGAGDVKLITGLGMWFSFPNIIYIVIISSLLGVLFGVYKLHKYNLLAKRLVPFFKGLYFRVVYGVKGVMVMEKLGDENKTKQEAIPFGTFMVIGAWIVFFMPYIFS